MAEALEALALEKDEKVWRWNVDHDRRMGGSRAPAFYPGPKRDASGNIIKRHTGYTPGASPNDSGGEEEAQGSSSTSPEKQSTKPRKAEDQSIKARHAMAKQKSCTAPPPYEWDTEVEPEKKSVKKRGRLVGWSTDKPVYDAEQPQPSQHEHGPREPGGEGRQPQDVLCVPRGEPLSDIWFW